MSDIATNLKRARQTIANVIAFLKDGHSAYDYYECYKGNKKRCGRKQTQLSQEMQAFIQDHLDLE